MKERSDKLKEKLTTCRTCATQFHLKRNASGEWIKRKLCPNCLKAFHQNHALLMNSDEANKKSWEKRKSMNLHKHLATPEARKKSGITGGKARIGKPRPKRSAINVPRKNRVILFTKPCGNTYRAISVGKFVRENPNLFDPADVVRSHSRGKSDLEGNATCKAMRGLASIVSKANNSWKGWTCMVINKSSIRLTIENQ